MHQRIITTFLVLGIGFATTILVSGMSDWRMPDNQQGYAPEQPIAYSHRLHAGELQIDCKFCHSAAESGRYAGIPSSDVCMKCHEYVTSSFESMMQERNQASQKSNNSPKEGASQQKPSEGDSSVGSVVSGAPALGRSAELQKLYDYLALDQEMKPIEGKEPTSVPWVRVHNLPDYVTFNHQAHVSAGVKCQQCHGPVESMERVHQHASLSMGWCVNCHRDAALHGINGEPVNASTDCSVCHH